MKMMIELIEAAARVDYIRELHEIEETFEHYKTMIVESEYTDKLFDETTSMLLAAKRGLGITNKLKNPAERKKNRSRVMTTMNKLRAQLQRIEKAIAAPESIA